MSHSSSSSAPPSSTLLSLKTQSRARDEEEKSKQRRKRGVVVMMCQFLTECGFSRSLDAIQQESGVSYAKHIPADNMDLLSIFQQFEEYYDIRYGRKPKFFRALEGEGAKGSIDTVIDGGEKVFVRNRGQSGERGTTGGRPPPASSSTPTSQQSSHASGFSAPSSAPGGITRTSSQRHPQHNTMPDVAGSKVSTARTTSTESSSKTGVSPTMGPAAPGGGDLSRQSANATPPGQFDVGGRSIPIRKGMEKINAISESPTNEDEPLPFEGRLALKPLPRFETAELNELAMTIWRDILDQDPTVSWKDVAELGNVKQLLKEAVLMPVKYPELFQGIVRPWHGILLFGPPGTGKTMMAKALATECRTTFFNVSASTIVSKWRGDSEKLVKMLFDLAVHYAPSTIFIDELDSIMTARTSDGSEHEGSRRMKTELLIQMDGLSKRKKGDVVFVLAASNVPWDLDAAMLRRLEKRVCVPLPTKAARLYMFERNLTSVTQDFNYDLVAEKTEGYSGADIDIVCREATMRTIRILIHRLENDKRLTNETIERPKVSTEDVLESINVTRNATSQLDPRKYTEWERKFGSTISY